MRWLLFFKNVKVNTVYGKFSEFFSKKIIYKKINYILSIAGIPAIITFHIKTYGKIIIFFQYKKFKVLGLYYHGIFKKGQPV